ncbi:MAG: hypothetical protein A2Y62_14370 [Candidatus Fischerbacteria bacterium RBG_13_37_8]|uniref:Fibronectin type-III domain-containing protein n=1 Tax=Candidatus Fischerbacteria bacterium RBG_13_37_8 TaxID=1817863 RepID=A0A1F5VNY9_9BACT|nr:MAG: hypothetical protein A2Y62_14370 [Candidatus Fischerbacteria bacterium RBG_13_37_8]
MSFTHGRSAFKLTTVATGDPGEVPMKDGSGTPLTMSKLGPDLIISWGVPGGTCQPTDYGIYRGTIGTYYSHDQFLCTDSGSDLTETIISDIASYYYLVVARSDTEEGSYGKNSIGTQRPVGTTKCVPTQNLTACN